MVYVHCNRVEHRFARIGCRNSCAALVSERRSTQMQDCIFSSLKYSVAQRQNVRIARLLFDPAVRIMRNAINDADMMLIHETWQARTVGWLEVNCGNRLAAVANTKDTRK